jgi:hypothetical protein
LKKTIVVAAWYIWWQRREFVKGESTTPASSSAFSMQALTLNYSSVPEKPTLREIIWSSPPGGSYKMSVDASYFPGDNGAAAAVIRNGRDSQGLAIVGCP